MNELFRMKYPVVLLFLILGFSCVEKKSAKKEINKVESKQTSTTDTLKFTSGVRSIFQDSKGNYWLGSHNEGVSYYNGQVFEYFTTDEGLAHNQVRTIQEDKSGNIWFGTSNGVSVYDGGQFRNYRTGSNNPIIDWNETSGDLWFYAGEEDGINRFNGTSMNYLLFPKPKNYSSKNSYGVTGIFNYNGIWTNIFDNEKLELKDEDVLHIRSVLADSKGRIWIGNNGIGVLLMENGKTIYFSDAHELVHDNSPKNGNLSPPGTMEHVFVIEEDSGAWKYDGKTMTNYTIDSKTPQTMIWSIYNDNSNNLLFGMADGEVYTFTGESFEKMF